MSLESESTPTQITKNIGDMSIKNVSKLLGELRAHGIVECLTPKSKKGRVYVLTKEGKNIFKRISASGH